MFAPQSFRRSRLPELGMCACLPVSDAAPTFTWKSTSFGVMGTRIYILTVVTSFVTLDNLLNSLGPQFPHEEVIK